MRFDIITIFPDVIESYMNESIMKRAQQKKKIDVYVHNLRDFTKDKHRTVDDTVYGGGPGMLLKVEPIYHAIAKVLRISKKKTLREFCKIKKEKGVLVILASAKGKTFSQTHAAKLSHYKRLVFICGRYEGVDERVLSLVDEEISIGDYVLTGGEIPVLTIVDAVTRLIPGVLGKDESSVSESHARKGFLEHPHYTKPESVEVFGKHYTVPDVLLSGDHKKIEEWREKKSTKLQVSSTK